MISLGRLPPWFATAIIQRGNTPVRDNRSNKFVVTIEVLAVRDAA